MSDISRDPVSSSAVPRPRRPRQIRPLGTRWQPSPEPLSIGEIPPLRNPMLIMAFEGWNDAGEAASMAAGLIVTQHRGTKIASVDPEEFFVFSDTRPHVRLTSRGRRRIDWPANEFFACRTPGTDPAARDLVVLRGTEPDLRWRTFVALVLEVAVQCEVELVVTLGALYGDIPHTMPPRVSGSAMHVDRHQLLRDVHYPPSRYEGQTGIVSVLGNRFADAGYPVVSLWGWAPHYITATPNPVVASRIIREVSRLLEIKVDTEALDQEAREFDQQVREAVEHDPEAVAYVQELERQAREEDEVEREDDQDRPARAGGELPSGAAMVDALEEFLRSRRRPPRGHE